MAVYKVINSWPDGFQGEITIMNHTTDTWAGWATNWTWPSGQSITQLWNGTHTDSGTSVAVINAPYNGTVNPGGTTTFGFLASTTGTNALPTVTCTGIDAEHRGPEGTLSGSVAVADSRAASDEEPHRECTHLRRPAPPWPPDRGGADGTTG